MSSDIHADIETFRKLSLANEAEGNHEASAIYWDVVTHLRDRHE